ncbi:MAG: branched-chain amino acid ABC transporter permease [Rubrobacteraceae bacterium]
MMVELVQGIVSGLFVGFAYAILGVGFSLAWGAGGVINVSHTAFAVLAAYLGYYANDLLGLDPLVALVGIVPAFFLIGVGFHGLLVRPLFARTRNPELASLVLTFGVATVLANAMVELFSADPRMLDTPYTETTLRLAGVSVPGGQAVAAALAVVVLVTVYIFLHHTYTGRAVRAVQQEREGAALSGINTGLVNAVTFGLAFATAGAAGVALSLVYSFGPTSYLAWLTFMFLVVIFGGVGSATGAGVAGLAAGLVVGVSGVFVAYAWVNLVLFVFLVLVLLVRPQGLFPR